MTRFAFVIAICFSLIAPAGIAHTQCVSCGAVPILQPPIPKYKRIWNEDGLKRYSMTLKEAGKYRADLTAKVLVELVKDSPGEMIRYAPSSAVVLADDTLIRMGLIKLQPIK